MLGDISPYPFDETDIQHKVDFTAWRKGKSDEGMSISGTLILDSKGDRGLIEFLKKFIGPEESGKISALDKVNLVIHTDFSMKEPHRKISVKVNNFSLDETGSREVVRRLRTGTSLVFHHSAKAFSFPFFHKVREDGLMAGLSKTDKEKIQKRKDALGREIRKAIKDQQRELSDMIGRLGERYEVRLSAPEVNFENVPLAISLAEQDYEIPLDDWGSGTRNQTLILRSIFNAKRVTQSESVSDILTPIVVIEEPESFLHPMAQAHFGKVLQDLSKELEIQVIATTHSPYMLSSRDPSSNILIARESRKRKSPHSFIHPTNESNWTKPFQLALGVNDADLETYKSLLFSDASQILMVEGETDRSYFEWLRDPGHGKNKLEFQGEIFPYGGVGNIPEESLMKFFQSKYKKLIVTLDLDSLSKVKNKLERMGLVQNKTFFGIGEIGSGKDRIEGLVPDSIITKVHASHPQLIRQLESSNSDDRNSAKQKLKRLYLEEVKKSLQPGSVDCNPFYKIVKKLNSAFIT